MAIQPPPVQSINWTRMGLSPIQGQSVPLLQARCRLLTPKRIWHPSWSNLKPLINMLHSWKVIWVLEWKDVKMMLRWWITNAKGVECMEWRGRCPESRRRRRSISGPCGPIHIDGSFRRTTKSARPVVSIIDWSYSNHREVLTPTTSECRAASTPPRHYVEGFANSVLAMAALKGTRRIYVQDQKDFQWGRVVSIHEIFAAQVIAYGSLVLDRALDRDYPVGVSVREVTPVDDQRVDSQGRTVINGVVMDPGNLPESSTPLDNSMVSGRQLPPVHRMACS